MKFEKKIFFQIRNFNTCCTSFYNRNLVIFFYKFKKIKIVNVGLNMFFYFKKDKILKKKILLKIYNFKNFFIFIKYKFVNFIKTVTIFFIWSLFKKMYVYKLLLKGICLNILKKGFAIGLCSFIAFLPKNHSLFFNKSAYSFFFICKLKIDKKIVILSQKKLNKSSLRMLFKLNLIFNFINVY